VSFIAWEVLFNKHRKFETLGVKLVKALLKPKHSWIESGVNKGIDFWVRSETGRLGMGKVYNRFN